jgi:hypothetical protein
MEWSIKKSAENSNILLSIGDEKTNFQNCRMFFEQRDNKKRLIYLSYVVT